MENLNIEHFNPKVAELQTLATKAQSVDITDLKAVKEVRIELKNARVAITKTGKAMRDDANAFAKAVIAKEKELVGIIEPEEERLKEAEAAEKQRVEREERKALLPARKERLDAIGDDFAITDDELLDMDGSQFEGYFNQRLASHNEAVREENERKEREIKEKEEALKREEETRAREEAARKEEREKAEREAKEKEERLAREAKEKEEREAREKKEAEEKAAAEEKAKQEAEAEEKRKLEASKKFQAWLEEQGYTEETKGDFKLVDNGDSVTLYKLVGNYKK